MSGQRPLGIRKIAMGAPGGTRSHQGAGAHQRDPLRHERLPELLDARSGAHGVEAQIVLVFVDQRGEIPEEFVHLWRSHL